MKRKLQALLALLLLGLVKLPLEQSATATLREAHLLSPPLDMGVRDSIGQMGFAASLGGLRSLVASMLYLQAYEAWTNVDWAKVNFYFNLTTRLQPRYDKYWDEAAWHMAYNAATHYKGREDLNAVVRENLYNEHIKLGEQILREAVKVNPGSPRLWITLGDLYANRLVQPQKAGECYLQARELTGLVRYARLAGYEYAGSSDSALWPKAYELLKQSYDQGQRPPSLINAMKDLEKKLDVPQGRRIAEKYISVEQLRGEAPR